VTAATGTAATALAAARQVADAVLYEGYLLYPYRASAAKNQVRWQFGVLSPAGAAEAGLGEQAALHAELLLRAGPDARLELRVRCLQVQDRAVQAATPAGFADVDELRAGGAHWVPWQEAVPRELPGGPFTVDELRAGLTVALAVPGGEETEELPAGRLVRTRQPLAAELAVRAERVDGHLRLTLDLRNTAVVDPAETTREQAARRAWVSTHLLVALSGGSVVSLVDPPPEAASAAASCRNRGWWPALVGDGLALVAPIILPDRAAVAPESHGDFFDATEIDEMLTLRVMTLTEEEKAAARGTDPRAAAIIDRCDRLPDGDLARLHGTRRDPVPGREPGAPWWDPGADASVSPATDSVLIAGVPVAKGSRVRLRPTRRADAQDIFLAGQEARVTAVLSDVDGEVHVAVVLVDDPAADLHDWYGRYWYFAPDEVEPLPSEVAP
jgi:hypothetical protein